MFRASIVFVFVLVGVVAEAKPLLATHPDGRRAESFVARGSAAMVASADGRASAAGSRVMEDGGSVADAAVAVAFSLAVLRPQSTGLGGGGFLLYRSARSKETSVYDFRECAPAKAHRDMYLDEAGKVVSERSLIGHLAVGVPGTVAGMLLFHKEEGRLPLSRVLQPAIDLASNGFLVYPDLARSLEKRSGFLKRNLSAREIFFDGDEVLKEGALLVQKDLAGTLRSLVRQGAAAFYGGDIAAYIERDMVHHGGLIRASDLSDYRVVKRKPVKGFYKGYDVFSMPPPSSGGVHILQMLRFLDGYPLARWGVEHPKRLHVLIEAMRQAFADRAYFLGDPDFVDVPVEALISEAYAKRSRRGLSLRGARKSKEVSHGVFASAESESTTHFSVMDGEGNMVSSTQTINYSFGACVVVPGTGIILNNEMDDFSANPGATNVYGLIGGEANAIEAGKRPLSSMSPTLVLRDGEPFMALGSPGGPRIITAVLQTLLRVIDHGQPLFEAVASGRLHHQCFPDRVATEVPLFSEESIASLMMLKHDVQTNGFYLGDVQAVQRMPDGFLLGVSDPRVNGKPVGYDYEVKKADFPRQETP